MKIMNIRPRNYFRKYSIPVPEGAVAHTAEEARQAAENPGRIPGGGQGPDHAGGRGKGGGVKLAHSADEVLETAGDIIGMNLVTHQTGPGPQVRKVLVEQGLDIAKELYLSIIPDRATAKIVIMASEAGGMDIEEVAEKTPEKIIKVYVDPLLGIQPYHCRETAFGLNLSPAAMKPFIRMLNDLYQLFVDTTAPWWRSTPW